VIVVIFENIHFTR